jgi:CDP-diacylglycerol--glycerol-3-phosphate 3-phosphatidyltransferase
MTLADKITSLRIILAPIFFIIFVFAGGAQWTIPVLWALFIISEVTDMLDGMAARKRGEVSDFGKLFDPFADTLVQVTYFLCFVIGGILPAFPSVILLLIMLYREFGIQLLRTMMMKKGIAMGARMGGKIKTVAYILAGGLALLSYSVRLPSQNQFLIDFGEKLAKIFSFSALVVFALAVFLAVLSFIDYFFVYRKTCIAQVKGQ